MKPRSTASLLLLLAGCGHIYAPPPAEPHAANTAGSTVSESMMEAKGVDLWLYDEAPTAGADRKPTCWVHADAFTLENDNAWMLDRAKAIIYAREADTPDIDIEARHGRFEESKMAYLRDGVTATVGTVHLQMEDVEWLNEERVLQTEHAGSITTDTMQLDVESLRLYPAQHRIEMTRVTGTVTLEGNEP